MKKKPLVLALLLSLSACQHYVMVEPKRTTIANTFSVEPQTAWNKFVPPDGPDKFETWTINGPLLDVVRFYSNVADGDTLFKLTPQQREKITLPAFKSSMEPQEIMELYESTVARITDSATKTRDLQPAKLGALPGFRFEMDITPRDEVARTALVVGAVRNKTLILIVYQAATLHYYPRYLPQVERMIDSVQIVEAR